MTKCAQCSGIACGDECDRKSHATTEAQMTNEKDREEARDLCEDMSSISASGIFDPTVEKFVLVAAENIARIRSEAVQAKEAEIAAILLDPAAVYTNYLRGTINASEIIKAEVTHKVADAVKAERERWEKTLVRAMSFAREYAIRNPRWTPIGMPEQDPNGVHAFIEEVDAILSD